MGDIVEEKDPLSVKIPMYGTGNPATRKNYVFFSSVFVSAVVRELSGSHQAVIKACKFGHS